MQSVCFCTSTKVDVSLRPRPFAGVKMMSFSVHEINRWLSSQPKGISVFVHGYFSCCIDNNYNIEVSNYGAAKSYLVSLNDVILVEDIPLCCRIEKQ
jgi:hypothetical protein